MLISESMNRCQSSVLFPVKNEGLEISVNSPYDFTLYYDLSLRGQQIPIPYIYSKTSWRCIIRTFSGRTIPIQVIPVENSNGSYLMVNILSDYSTEEASEIRKCITQVFCSDLDLSQFYQKVVEDPGLSEIVNRLTGLKPYLSQDPFEALIKAVVRQLVHADTARRSIMKLVLRFGIKQTVGEENYFGFPLAEMLSKAPKNELIECKLGYKWKLVKTLSSDIVSGDLDLHELSKISDEEIIERLEEYKGIGYWTSRIFLYDGLKRLNAYPIHDISLRKAISMIYFQRKPVSWEEVESFFTGYEGYEGIATNYLFGALWLERCPNIQSPMKIGEIKCSLAS